MVDFNKAIPHIEFVPNRKPVAKPSDEPMVYLNDLFECDSDYYHWYANDYKPLPGTSPYIMARETVVKQLQEAEALLPEGYHFKIFDAYRPIAVQQALYNHSWAERAKEHPGASKEEIDAYTALCTSFPSYNILLPSLHNTGGAVDLTIVGPDGEPLDMGCEFDEFTDRPWTDYYEDWGQGAGLNDEARDNRRLLYNAMISVGFTNFPSEWWHFDYGDEKWAQFSGTTPFYAGILDAGLLEALPYEHMEKVIETNNKEQELLKEIIELRRECEALDEKLANVMRNGEK